MDKVKLGLEQLTLENSSALSAPVPHQKDIQDKENVLLPPHPVKGFDFTPNTCGTEEVDMEMTMAYPTVTMNVPVIPDLCGTKMEKLLLCRSTVWTKWSWSYSSSRWSSPRLFLLLCLTRRAQ